VSAPTDLAPAQHPLARALRAALARHRDAVLTAPTGAGKSTIVPLALLDEAFVAGHRILMLEPRRVAARAVAARMAATLRESVGATVGYRMRLDTRVSSATRIEVVTEGVLTRLLQEDPALERVACVIFDEFHERSLQADTGLALCLDARRQLDAQFRVLVMSATLESERVAASLRDAAVVSVPGRSFAVEVQYLGRGAPWLPGRGAVPLERQIVAAVQRALTETSGDVLVFLPGASEIRRAQRSLETLEPRGSASLQTVPLYGELGAAEQDAALEPAGAGVRKIVLATNIAETSLTIPGVTAVVDSGLVRRARFDPASGMSALLLQTVSRASAEQRTGRAGRVAPGVCYRLWSESAQAALAPFTPPEILEADLVPLALELARWGTDAAALSWLDTPPAATLARSRELLTRLGALDAHGRLTAMGMEMARRPAHPRLSHMLVASRQLDTVPLAAELAALLSERDLLRSSGAGARDVDVRTRVELLRGEEDASSHDADRTRIDRGALQRARRTAQQLARMIGGERERTRPQAALPKSGDEVGGLLALAYPDRIGRRRGAGERRGPPRPGEGRFLLSNGRGATLAGSDSLARAEFIVAVELDDRQADARIDLAAPVARVTLEQLFAERILDEERIAWDEREQCVTARRIRRLDALVLEDKPLASPAPQAAQRVLLEAVQRLGIEALPWDEEAHNLQARMQFVARLGRADQAGWPPSDDAALLATAEQWLGPWLEGITRRDQLARVPLADALRARLTPAQRRALDELAPRELIVPTGSRVRIDYVDDNAPVASVRLQEVFGLRGSPRIGGGNVPVTFKLLSPAQRPVQITRDLEGFWRGSYAEVRRDMRGRYPKHHWPEDPLAAAPTRGPKRR
jgi:ATP-dependent helicase HrpB